MYAWMCGLALPPVTSESDHHTASLITSQLQSLFVVYAHT